MKLYLNAFLITIVVICVVWVALFYVTLGSPVSKSRWIDSILELKEQAAFAVTGEKVVFVSGSNIIFGLDSQRLADSWDMPVINFGLHAGLGVAYILERSKRVLRAGDIAILPLEYPFYREDGTLSETLIVHVFSSDPEYFYSLSLADKARFIARMEFKRLKRGLKASFQNDADKREQELDDSAASDEYSIANMNASGDQVNIEPEKISATDRDAIYKLKAYRMDHPGLSGYSRTILHDYIGWAEDNGVCLIFMPPNYMYFDEYNGPLHGQFFMNIKSYLAGNDAPYIGDPYDYMFDKSYYFETVYHLDSLGVEKRTEQIVKDIDGNLTALCESY
jgi:hypothetical protein